MYVVICNRITRVLLVLSNDDHHGHAGQQGEDLHDALLEGGALQQLGDHMDSSDVDEASGREWERHTRSTFRSST